MDQIDRDPPQGKPVSLFVTCMVDMLAPQTGLSVVEVLEHLGVPVNFPAAQTCCGQPAFNAGYRREARQVATDFLEAFSAAQVIVTPSGSCAAMVRHEFPRLFATDPALQAEAKRLAAITWEFTEFIVDGLGITDLPARLPTPQTVACHHACHGLRLLGLKHATETLLANIPNVDVLPWDNSEICCGFGGLFSIKMADVSGAMLAKKLEHITKIDADCIITGDVSCLTHMNSGLEKLGTPPVVRHIADVLAEGLRQDKM